MGAALLGTAEALHAGRFLATDDEPALVVLRFAGVGLLSMVAVTGRMRPMLFSAGGVLIVAGTAWGAVVGGGIADPAVGPHVLIALGSLLLAGWAWLASRDSIRLRVLTALVAMLAIAVVAGGGAVSRVAALDKRNEQLRQLGSAATAMSSELGETASDLARRAALLAPLVAPDLDAPGDAAITSIVGSALRGSEVESIAVFDPRGLRALASSGTPSEPAYDREKLAGSAVVRAALAGTASTSYDVTSGRLVIIGAAPIVRAGNPEVVGAVAIARSLSPNVLRGAARDYAPDAEIVLLGSTSAASERVLLGVEPRVRAGDDVGFERLVTADGTRPAAVSTIAPGVRLVVVGSDDGAVEAATGLLRALLIGILAAALLAVVVALWLSARVTRPIIDLAEGAERVKADFLSSVSHELRTPLTPIRGYTDILRRGRIPARRAAEYLDEIGEAATRLERIVALLLDVAAQEAGRFHVETHEVKPADVLAEAAERWSHLGKRHPVRVSVGRSLPRVGADPDVVARVLDELIDNAVKFSPDGSTIDLRARRTKEGVEISVADGGIGISPEQAGELTGAFAQVESGDRRRFGGLGLGLAFVSGALDAHASRLTLRSEPGTGTTFAFTLSTGMVTRMPAGTARRRSEEQI